MTQAYSSSNGTRNNFWDDNRNQIRSVKGGWRIGEGVFLYQHNLLAELMGDASYFQVMTLSVTGELPSRKFADWLEAYYVCMSFPDPRIWCNQIASLAGSSRCTPVSAVATGNLASDSSLYGPGCALAATAFIREATQWDASEGALTEFFETRVYRRGRLLAPGYSRPIARGDERVVRLRSYADRLGFKSGPHLQAADELEQLIFAQSGDSMNLLGYVAAFMLDQGISPEHSYALTSLSVSAGLLSCFEEATTNPSGGFLPLRCDDIEYRGVPQRQLPEET